MIITISPIFAMNVSKKSKDLTSGHTDTLGHIFLSTIFIHPLITPGEQTANPTTDR